MNRRLCTQAVAVATILAPTRKLPLGPPGRTWRASRAAFCEGEAVAVFARGRELLPRRPPGYTGVGSTSEHDNMSRLQENLLLSTRFDQIPTLENSPSFKDKYIILRAKRAKFPTYPFSRVEIWPNFVDKDKFLRSEKSTP